MISVGTCTLLGHLIRLGAELFFLQDVLESLQIQAESFGLRDIAFKKVAALNEAQPDSLLFIHRPVESTLVLLSEIQAAAVLIPTEWFNQNFAALRAIGVPVVAVDSPRWVAARVQARTQPNDEVWGEGVHPSAIVSPEAELAKDVVVGPFSVVGRCVVGEGSRIAAFCRLHDDVRIGSRVCIRDHVSIGGVGFGVERGPGGMLARFPHHGSVEIEDGVEIFPYANVDRGTFGPTRLGQGTFIDHYVHIGHNSDVGKHCIITARVVLCGKSFIEDQVWLGVGSIIREGRRVGAGATVGLGTVVIKDVLAGETVAGVPARLVGSKPKLA